MINHQIKPKIKNLAIGTVQFGLDYWISNFSGKTIPSEVSGILNLANSSGITYLDTASVYGSSEEVLGQNNLNNFNVISKWPSLQNGNLPIDFLVKSLEKLNIQSLYGWLSHHPDILIEQPDLFIQTEKAKEKGLILKTGFSVSSVSQLKNLIARFGTPDIVQMPFNILDKRFEKIMLELKSKGTEIHTRSAFLQGLLFLSPEKLSSFFNPVKPWLYSFQEAFPTSEAQVSAALNYCVNHPAIDKVVIGVNSIKQLEININSLNNSFNSEFPRVPHLNESIINPSKWPLKI